MQDELPALCLRQEAESRHAGVRVAAADLPEQRTVGLRVNVRRREIRRLRRPTSIRTVTGRTALLEHLCASRRRFTTLGKRVRPRDLFGWRSPFRIALADL